MHAFFSHRSIRSAARLMVMAWLVALAAGVAHACVGADGQARYGVGHGPEAAASSLVGSGQHPACQGSEPAGPLGWFKLQADTPVEIAAAPAGAPAWRPGAVASYRSAAGAMHGAPAGVRPSVFIDFLRLTL